MSLKIYLLSCLLSLLGLMRAGRKEKNPVKSWTIRLWLVVIILCIIPILNIIVGLVSFSYSLNINIFDLLFKERILFNK